MHRDEIASCSEQAYLHLSVKAATKLMMFHSEADLLKYSQQVRCHHLKYIG